MGLSISPEVVIYFILGLVLLYGLGWLLLVPFKKIMRLVANSLAGALVFFLINLIGSGYGYAILLNPFSALVTGFLGIPGVLLSAVLQWILQ